MGADFDTETVMRNRLLLNRFLTVLNREDWEFYGGLDYCNQSILEGLIRAMPQLTERNQLM